MVKYFTKKQGSWLDYIKISDGKKEVITIWETGEIDLYCNGNTGIQSMYSPITRTEFEMAKLKLCNYIEKL